MRICDLHTGVIRLTKSGKRLRDQWEETKSHWTDRNAEDFEHNHLQPLSPQLTLALAAVNRLAALLEQAERDCWDEDRSG